MARTLILNISAEAQTLPAAFGSYAVSVGHGRVVSDESSLVVAAMGGFEAMHGLWAVSAISSDEALGDVDVASGGVALLASFIAGGVGGGGPTYWADILNKPAFANVATSGAYADLTGKPALSDVATSGLYEDLSGTPTLPSAANTTPAGVSTTGAAGVLSTYARGDHQHAHGNLSGGTLHSEATTITAGFMAAADKSKLDGLAAVATSGAYADLSGVPAQFSGAYADLSGKPTLAAIATSGSAADLANNPYDIIANATGALTVGQVVMKAFAPRALTFSSVTQASTTTAAVQIKVDGVAASYPQSVAQGALIEAVVTVAGTDCWFTVTGKVA